MKPGGIIDRAWPLLVTPALLFPSCGCAYQPSPRADACVAEAQAVWRNAVAKCAIDQLSPKECGLEQLTETRRASEERCIMEDK